MQWTPRLRVVCMAGVIGAVPLKPGVSRCHHFMNTLTQEQLKQLTPEQQTDLATVELRRVQKRQRLLKQARESRYFIFASAGGLAVAYGVAAISRAPFWSQVSIFALAMAILVQTVSVNRRLDALMELLENEQDG